MPQACIAPQSKILTMIKNSVIWKEQYDSLWQYHLTREIIRSWKRSALSWLFPCVNFKSPSAAAPSCSSLSLRFLHPSHYISPHKASWEKKLGSLNWITTSFRSAGIWQHSKICINKPMFVTFPFWQELNFHLCSMTYSIISKLFLGGRDFQQGQNI